MTKLNFDDFLNLRILLSIDGIGPVKIRSLMNKFHNFENIVNADLKTLQSVDGINFNLAKRIVKAKENKESFQSKLQKEFDKLEKMNARVITIWDDEYPLLLEKIYDPPLILYTLGNLTEDYNYSIAIVGTRQPTNYGKIQVEKFATELASQNIPIVSGLARGIDSIAHRSVLKTNGKTIAVLGSGLDVIYPPENKKLFEEIAEKGAIISEYELGTKPDAPNFPRRNRIIAGLSVGILVIETGINGGAMLTANIAFDQNRNVFAIPGNIGVHQSEGTNLLIKRDEAKLIQSVDDILFELETELKPILGQKSPQPIVELNVFEEKILSCFNNNDSLHIDSIAHLSSLSVSDCLVYLLSLEFKGLIKQLPGKMFVRF